MATQTASVFFKIILSVSHSTSHIIIITELKKKFE